MTFYHGTSEENWKKIKQEGVLFGDRGTPSRCTYLALDENEARQYGPVVLKVEYDPLLHSENNNYIIGCWQFRVYEPITIENITRI